MQCRIHSNPDKNWVIVTYKGTIIMEGKTCAAMEGGAAASEAASLTISAAEDALGGENIGGGLPGGGASAARAASTVSFEFMMPVSLQTSKKRVAKVGKKRELLQSGHPPELRFS